MSHAQQPAPPPERAAYEAFRRGTEALTAHQYDVAVRALEESYRLRRAPVVLYPLALAYRELGHTRAAIENFERYLTEEQTFPPGRDAAVREAVRDLRARLATVAIAVTPTTFALSVDGRATPATNVPMTLDPGDHELTVTAPGYVTWRGSLHLDPGQRIERTVTLERELPRAGSAPTPVTMPPRVAVPVEVSRPVTMRWWFWTGAAVVVIGGITASVLVANANAETEPWAPGTTFNVVTIRVP